MKRDAHRTHSIRTALAAVMVTIAGTAAAQEPAPFRSERPAPPEFSRTEFRLPGSLRPQYRFSPLHMPSERHSTTATADATAAVFRSGKLPARISVLGNNTLRFGNRFDLSNGQAWNWGPYPNAFLDARTLSFPMPR